jgi:Tol biopolymer transport system component
MTGQPGTSTLWQPSLTRCVASATVPAEVAMMRVRRTVPGGAVLCLAAAVSPVSAQELRLVSRAETSLAQDSAGGGLVAVDHVRPVSADGRYVVFSSSYPFVVPGQVDTHAHNDVFLLDRVSGAVALVSHVPGSPTTAANHSSGGGAISDDGQWVVFMSRAEDLVPGQVPSTGALGVYLYERATGLVTLVSHAAGSSTRLGNRDAALTSITADGSHIVFESTATDHVAGQVDTNDHYDVFLFTRATGQIALVSRQAGSATATANGESRGGAISADGSVVAFASLATNLTTTNDFNGRFDVFLFDRASATMTLVSRSVVHANRTATFESNTPSVSQDGRFIAFASFAQDLVAGVAAPPEPFGPTEDVFVFDRVAGTNQLLSYAANRTDLSANSWSRSPRISRDGNWVAFLSDATDLVPGQADLNADADVFLAERGTGQVTLVSRAPGAPNTTASRGFPRSLTLSADGAFVGYLSSAGDLVAGQDDSGGPDVFMFARSTGVTTLLTRRPGTLAQAANGSHQVALSLDGAHVVFSSSAPDLVAGWGDQNVAADVFRWEAAGGVVFPVSRSHSPRPPATAGARSITINPASGAGSYYDLHEIPGSRLSADGRYAVFESEAPNLVPGQVDPVFTTDVFLFDRVDGSIRLVSRRAGTVATAADQGSWNGSISADGRFVVFESGATDLTDDGAEFWNVFLYERATGAVTLVSRSVSGFQGWPSFGPAISADGAWVAFTSEAGDLVPDLDDRDGYLDVFLWERATRTVTLVSRSATGGVASEDSVLPRIDAAGRYVVFRSRADNLVDGQVDPHWQDDIFLFDRITGTRTLVTRTAGTTATAAAGMAQIADISADGRRIVFDSSAPDLVAGLAGSSPFDVYLYDVTTSSMSLVSRAAASPSTRGGGGGPRISADGSTVMFLGNAANLVAGHPATSTLDLFLSDVITGSITLVSHVAGLPFMGAGVDVTSLTGGISRDGEQLTFTSFSSSLVPPDVDTNPGLDVFTYERSSGAVRLLSRPSAGQSTAFSRFFSHMSEDGNWVLFDSPSPGLVADDFNSEYDVFLFGPLDLIFADGFEGGVI